MTQKRRRRRPQNKAEVAVEEASREKEPRGRLGAKLPESPFPALGPTLGHGFRVVGSSPAIIAVALMALLPTWGAFVLLGDDAGPRTLSLLLSAPPVHVFSDAPVVLGPGTGGVYSALAVVGFAVLRAITFALLTTLILQALRDGKTSMRGALRVLPRSTVVFGGLYLIEFGLVVAAFQLLVGFLGQLAILSIAAGLYFLAFAPIVAAAEGAGPREALRRGFRAARLPGMRHLSLVLAYFLILFYSGAIAPFGILTPATPSIGAWAYSLGWTFVHVSVLAAFAYRWLAVREKVPSGPREA
ncbi:MAG: hypothetical protein ACRDH9_02210 [Actinomycetota bacterium]